MKDKLGHGSNPRGVTQGINGSHLPVWYHGSPTGKPHSKGPIHLGTLRAAREALESRIGIPADGKGWRGKSEYGKTLLAGQDTMNEFAKPGHYYTPSVQTGFNADAPDKNYYPEPGAAHFSDGSPVPMNAKPDVRMYEITGAMGNSPSTAYSDTKANALAKAQVTRGRGVHGFYYENDGEDAGSISAVVPSAKHLKGPV